MYSESVYSPVQLPAKMSTILCEFLYERDQKVSDQMAAAGMEPSEINRLRSLWSMTSLCLMSADLTTKLQEGGIQSDNVINENALNLEYEVDDGFAVVSNKKSHLLVRSSLEGEKIFIDPFWQQFLVDTGMTIEDVHKNPDSNLVPQERILCYRAEQLDDLAFWFSAIVRNLQEKTNTGSLKGKTDMLTRKLSVAQVFLGQDVVPPADYYGIARLEAIAKNIWDPKNYKEIDDAGIEKLAAKNN